MSGQRAVNDISPVVVLLCGVMVLAELIFALAEAGVVGGRLGIGWRVAAIEDYGVSGQLVSFMWESNIWPAEHLIRFVSYPFLHSSFMHMLFPAALLLALGKFVGDRFAWWAVAMVFVVSSVTGALAWALLGGQQGWLIGGFPPAYGMIGAFTYVLWLQLRSAGENQLRAFQLIGLLLAIRLVLGLLFGSDGMWIAEIAGFLSGFAVSFLVSPAALRGCAKLSAAQGGLELGQAHRAEQLPEAEERNGADHNEQGECEIAQRASGEEWREQQVCGPEHCAHDDGRQDDPPDT